MTEVSASKVALPTRTVSEMSVPSSSATVIRGIRQHATGDLRNALGHVEAPRDGLGQSKASRTWVDEELADHAWNSMVRSDAVK